MTIPATIPLGGSIRDHFNAWTDPYPWMGVKESGPWLHASKVRGAILAGNHQACIEVGNAFALNPAEWLSLSTKDFKAPKGCGFDRVLVDAATVGDVSREIQNALSECARPHRMRWHWIDRDVL
ncbi:MAG: hypothetical protein ACRDTI_05745 [Mycobacterium sp.]